MKQTTNPYESRPAIVYLAGPYSSATYTDYTRNIGRLFAMMHVILPTPVICAPLLTAGSEHMQDFSDIKHEHWLDHCFSLIEVCSSMMVVPEYHNSTGTLREIEFAQKRNMPVTIMTPPSGDALQRLLARMSALQVYHPFAGYAFDWLFTFVK